MVYKQVEIDITPSQMRKASHGKSIQLTGGQVASTKHKIYVHPANYEKIMKAKKKGCGCRLNIEHGEINHDLDKMQGGSLWSWIRDKAIPWVTKNAPILKPIASAVADAGATLIPALAPARAGLKQLTGIGVKGGRVAKGSQEAKDRMARLRAMKKDKKMTPSGSFRLN